MDSAPLPEKIHDEIDHVPDDRGFAFFLLLKPLEFLVREGRGIFRLIPEIVLFHGDSLFPLFCNQVFPLFLLFCFRQAFTALTYIYTQLKRRMSG